MVSTELTFWGAMSAAVAVGSLTAYPINVWLVKVGMKHGMGTVRALGKGGHSQDAEWARWPTGGPRAARARAGSCINAGPIPAISRLKASAGSSPISRRRSVH